jgi:hypothetical protein
VSFGPAHHHPRSERKRLLGPETRLTLAAEHDQPLLRVRVGVRVGDLARREALKGEVVIRPRRDRNPPEPRRAQLDQTLGRGTEDPEIVQDLRKITDRVRHPKPVNDRAKRAATGPPWSGSGGETEGL